MDFFYKPNAARPDECRALEENYTNCLLQKSLKDRVMNNKCVMDSILWFHLECPKQAAAFDDPDTFKLKFRDFFAHTKADAEIIYTPDIVDKLRIEYNTNRGPDDITYKKEIGSFQQDFKQANPDRVLDENGETDDIQNPWAAIEISPEDRDYQPERYVPPISLADSARFGTGKPATKL